MKSARQVGEAAVWGPLDAEDADRLIDVGTLLRPTDTRPALKWGWKQKYILGGGGGFLNSEGLCVKRSGLDLNSR